jgi:hypothetical protein
MTIVAQAIKNWRRRIGLPPSRLCEVDMISVFNDAAERTFADIVELIREAREVTQVDAYIARMEVSKPKSGLEVAMRLAA